MILEWPQCKVQVSRTRCSCTETFTNTL